MTRRPATSTPAGTERTATRQSGSSGALQQPYARTATSRSWALTPADLEEAWQLARQVRDGWLLGLRCRATAKAYAADLRCFFGFCVEKGWPPLSCTRVQVDQYVVSLTDGQTPLSAKTVARRLTTLAGFFRWAMAEDLLVRDPMTYVERPRLAHEPPPQTLDRDDIVALLGAAQMHSSRASALCHVLLLNGLRISEIVSSNVEGLGSERGHRTLRVTRKGGRVTRVPLAPPTTVAIDTYVDSRRRGPLLLSRTGRRLDRSNAARLLAAVGEAALTSDKARALHPHMCRHAFITACLDSGASVRDVQDAAGHQSASMTRLYDDGRFALQRNPTYGLADWLNL